MFTARAKVGCRWPTTADRSYDGIPAAVSSDASGFGAGPGFTARKAGVAFLSRDRRGWRDACGVAVVVTLEFAAAAAAAAGQTVAVVVRRAVRFPAALVLVVKIPADGFLLRASGGGNVGLPAATADWQGAGRLSAAALGVVVEGSGIASRHNSGVRNWGIPAQQRGARSRPNPDSGLGPCDWSGAPSNDNTDSGAVGLARAWPD